MGISHSDCMYVHTADSRLVVHAKKCCSAHRGESGKQKNSSSQNYSHSCILWGCFRLVFYGYSDDKRACPWTINDSTSVATTCDIIAARERWSRFWLATTVGVMPVAMFLTRLVLSFCYPCLPSIDQTQSVTVLVVDFTCYEMNDCCLLKQYSY